MNKADSKTFHFSRLFQPQFGLIWMLFAMLALFSLTSAAFRTPDNLLEILRASGINAILILGLTWILAIGELDVSFADVAALVSMIAACFVMKSGVPLGLAIVAAFVGGTLIGAINGFMAAYMKIPSLITTIATGFAAKAVAKILNQGKPLAIITNSKLVYNFVFGEILSIPVLFLTALVIYIISYFLQDHTTMGQHLYALGENRQATREAGIKESKIVFYYFTLNAAMASVAGILVTAQLGSGVSEIGGGTLMIQGFTAVFLGALVVKAGKHNVIGTFIGVVILTVLVNWITLLGWPTFIVWLTRGTMLIAGVSIVTLLSYRQRKASQLQME
ncbi:MAG: ABC transporter permease [Desulfobacteraceae bacterium]|nr:MAG: ABC transporter permease [Desulfobacteraceae bacterium]